MRVDFCHCFPYSLDRTKVTRFACIEKYDKHCPDGAWPICKARVGNNHNTPDSGLPEFEIQRWERAHEFAGRYNAGYNTLSDLLANENIDAVSILTPSGMHRDHALEALDAGKHVLVEKPIALRPDHVAEIAHGGK